ncbi:MAG: hypothetical protein ACKOJB_05330 [Chthoniobacterales bacterium]
MHAQEMAAVVPEEKPPTVERFEEPAAAPAGQTNSADFRFTYPVRDTQSDRIYTEANPPATGDAPSEAAATATTTSPAQQSQSAAATVAEQDAETSLELAEETFIGEENMPQQAWADIGEGRFEKRPFRYSFAVYEGYNSNVNGSTTDPVESLYTAIAAGMDYAFGSSRLNLGISLDAALDFYYNNEQLQNDGLFPTITLALNANYKATPRLDLSFVNSTALLSQPDFASGSGGPSNYQGDYISSSTTLSAAYRWSEKFNTVTSYAPLVTYYFQTTGSNLSNFEQTVGQQFVFLWKPLTQLVAEYRFNLRNYFELSDYNSLGNYALLGFNHRLNPRSTIVFRGGAEQRISQNPVAGGTYNYIGPFGELICEYAFGERTKIGLNSRYGTTGTGVNDYTQNHQFRVGLEASHRLGRRVSLGAFINYQNNAYAQPGGDVDGVDLTPSFSYNVFNAGLNAGCFIIPDKWSLQAGYTFTTQVSGHTEQQGDDTQNVLYLGTQLDI